MIIHLGRWLERIKFIGMFVIMTYAFSYVYQWVTDWIDPTEKYKQPEGNAVKAFSVEDDMQSMNTVDRLKWFYWYGE
ncbi:YqzK family protein [Marinicrinis lubricantis]|uniref:YqzK family protein n=1 Tax=Marinicrinis lubricantis TaxID=2086470 RepID=A0ABW1ISG9_9BACL